MFDQLTSSELVAAYNSAQTLLGRESDSHVKKFSDKKTAVARLERVQKELVAMHGQAQLVRKDDVLVWDTDTRQPSQRPMLSTLDLTAQLRVLSEVNPKRPGARAHALFALYDGVNTGEEYVTKLVAAGYSRKLALSTLHWDTERGFVRLGE